MLVYGDLERVEAGASLVAGIDVALSTCLRLPAGLKRHAALVNAFLRAGQLAQGIADAEFEGNGGCESCETRRDHLPCRFGLVESKCQSFSGSAGGCLLPVASSLPVINRGFALKRHSWTLP
ncbi:hypothetical protein J2Y48_004847 [Mycoplana sp. BE70]|uniref:hypothetical protein n=1 Tax=Mycoplana sp. BE70 TaxID=2817775 RepID=UPI00285966B7|nr:hypothetical protein [Mycoplana sp. BE70]MDR6759531.1 hypothetical protein [Mycoplana sp. BE70]